MIVSVIVLAAARGSIVLIIAAIAAHALRARAAALRHSVWTIAIASQLVMPVAGMLLPQRDVTLGAAGRSIARAASVVTATLNAPTSVVNAAAPVERAPESAASAGVTRSSAPPARDAAPDMRRLRRVLAIMWMVGALVVGLRYVVGTILVARDTRRARLPVNREWVVMAGRIQEELHVHRSAELLLGTRHAVPYTWGVLSPVICLPADAGAWSPDRLRIVLMHELAHVGRFDALTEVMAQLAIVVFWFNPLLWLAVRHMRAEREHACDDRVLMGGVKPSLYVEELLTMMKAIGTGVGAPGFGAIAMARRSQFERRMLAVLDDRSTRTGIDRRTVAVLGAAMMILLLGIASVRPAAATPLDARFTADNGVAAVRWDQSDFDAMVDDCHRMRESLRVRVCEVRTVDVSATTGPVDFRGGYIDGVIFTSKGAPRMTTARALVRAEATTMADARALASRITTSLTDGVLRSDGPGDGRSSDWSVLYEVTMPAGSSVKARTELGQIGLREFQGTADIEAVNGPLQVIGAAGDIRGRTQNGPIYVGLGGTRWQGAGLDLQSQNGPIYVAIPPRYSAHLITGTTNGPMELSYPLVVQRMNSKRIEADVGAGGPTIRVTTLNGPADIR